MEKDSKRKKETREEEKNQEDEIRMKKGEKRKITETTNVTYDA